MKKTKSNCFYITGNEQKINNKKPYKGYCTADFNYLKIAKVHNYKIPEYAGLLCAIIMIRSGSAVGGLLEFLGAYLGYYLMILLVVVLIDKIADVKVSKQQIQSCYKEDNSQRIIINLTNGNNLAISGDDAITNNVINWLTT